MNTKKTREAILDYSIRIFNERKSSKVSTVQIASEMGISPGNLYYYFHNKEEIIRCIWNERIHRDILSYAEFSQQLKSGGDVVKYCAKVVEHVRAYQFFYSEIATLLFNDHELACELKAITSNNTHSIHGFVVSMKQNGLTIEMTEEETLRVADFLWAMIGKMFYGNCTYSFYYDLDQKIDSVFLVNILISVKGCMTDAAWNEVLDELCHMGIDYNEILELLKKQYLP